jgi:hypothetical protein
MLGENTMTCTPFTDCKLGYYFNGTDCINQLYFENLLDWKMDLMIIGIVLIMMFVLLYLIPRTHGSVECS